MNETEKPRKLLLHVYTYYMHLNTGFTATKVIACYKTDTREISLHAL